MEQLRKDIDDMHQCRFHAHRDGERSSFRFVPFGDVRRQSFVCFFQVLSKPTTILNGLNGPKRINDRIDTSLSFLAQELAMRFANLIGRSP